MTDSPPLLLFFLRELNTKAFEGKPESIVSWAILMADRSVQSRSAEEFLAIAAALPLPTSPRHQQIALECALCMVPTRPLWHRRSSPRQPIEDQHKQYFARAEEFLSKLLAQPGINPFSKLQHRDLVSRLGNPKLPLAVIAMRLGRPELLAGHIHDLPDQFRKEAVIACALFSQVELAEQLIAAWPSNDDQGKLDAQSSLWKHLSLSKISRSTGTLPRTDPPRAWWSASLLSYQSATPAYERILKERPELKPEWTRAVLCSDRSELLLRLQVSGGLEDRPLWGHREGWKGPPRALVISSALSASAERDPPSTVHALRLMLNLVDQMTPAPFKDAQLHKDWVDIGNWIAIDANPQTAHPAHWSGSWEQMVQVSDRWRPVMLSGTGGEPALGALAPIAKAAWAACAQGYEDKSVALDHFLGHHLPLVRELALRTPGQPSREQAAARKTASQLLLRPYPMKTDSLTPSNIDTAVEALLWRAAFSRLDARAKNGPGRLFPTTMRGAKVLWDAAAALVEQGAVPRWSQEDAKCFHALVASDPKFPTTLRVLVEADALRAGKPLAIASPRRV